MDHLYARIAELEEQNDQLTDACQTLVAACEAQKTIITELLNEQGLEPAWQTEHATIN